MASRRAFARPRLSSNWSSPSHLCSARSLATRPDLFGNLESKPRPTASTQLLDAISSDSAPRSASPISPRRADGLNLLGRMADNLANRRTGNPASPNMRDTLSRVDQVQKSRQIERMQYRPWRAGDVYAPRDLSMEEMRQYSRFKAPSADVFDRLNINPLDEYKNLPLMMDFVSALGRLKHQKDTGLRPVNQRKISKAVRRASALGLLPRTHAHPEMLRRPGPWQRKS